MVSNMTCPHYMHDVNILKTEPITELGERSGHGSTGSAGFPTFKINNFSKNKKNLKNLEKRGKGKKYNIIYDIKNVNEFIKTIILYV